MNEFLLLFRLDIISKDAQPSPEQLKVYMEQWQQWIDEITAAGKLAGGNHLSVEGRVINDEHTITDGPYVEVKESVAGYLIIKAEDFEDATVIAGKCPILNGKGNTVEVRKIAGLS